jgi:hypothetical protein
MTKLKIHISETEFDVKDGKKNWMLWLYGGEAMFEDYDKLIEFRDGYLFALEDIAKLLNLSFRQEGEYIYLEGK